MKTSIRALVLLSVQKTELAAPYAVVMWRAEGEQFIAIGVGIDSFTYSELSRLLKISNSPNDTSRFIELKTHEFSKSVEGKHTVAANLHIGLKKHKLEYKCSELFAKNLAWFNKDSPKPSDLKHLMYHGEELKLLDVDNINASISNLALLFAKDGSAEYQIEEDYTGEVTVYQFIKESCTNHYHQDDVDMAKRCALDEFGVPLNAWKTTLG